MEYIHSYFGNSLVVQWLGLHAFTAMGPGSVPGWGTKILQTARCRQKKKKKSYSHIIIIFFGCVGSSFCARAFSSYGKRGPLFNAVRGPLTIAASLVAGHRLQTRRLSSSGSRAQLLRGMWDPPRPGLEPVSPALAGRFSTTAPPGKPHDGFFGFS